MLVEWSPLTALLKWMISEDVMGLERLYFLGKLRMGHCPKAREPFDSPCNRLLDREQEL